MPRGYLKHNKEVGQKKSRGGSSGSRCVAEKDPNPPRIRRVVEDFNINAPRVAKSSPIARKAAVTYPRGECAICFKECDVVCLSKKCRWHEAACRQCLHRIYITNAQKSTKSYPLTCFHPLCDQPVHATQLDKHNLFASPAEAQKHHDMIVMSKIQKTDGMRTVHCPECDTPRGIRKLDGDRTLGCKNCHASYEVSPFYATMRALENMGSDDFGENDGWAKCPTCSMLISKGDGCSHMECTYCGCDFDWHDAQERKIRHARVPDGEIYLWW